MKISKISFGGIYDIRFPAGTHDNEIKNTYKNIQDCLSTKEYKLIASVYEVDKFNVQKTEADLEEKGLRIATTIDNSYLLCKLFEKINKDLSQQYIDKTKVELILDTTA